MRVYDALRTDGVDAGRRAVSMIVGRDTSVLDAAGVTRAAVETIAENTSDGVIAPMLYTAIGKAGAWLCIQGCEYDGFDAWLQK